MREKNQFGLCCAGPESGGIFRKYCSDLKRSAFGILNSCAHSRFGAGGSLYNGYRLPGSKIFRLRGRQRKGCNQLAVLAGNPQSAGFRAGLPFLQITGQQLCVPFGTDETIGFHAGSEQCDTLLCGSNLQLQLLFLRRIALRSQCGGALRLRIVGFSLCQCGLRILQIPLSGKQRILPGVLRLLQCLPGGARPDSGDISGQCAAVFPRGQGR